jgi:hypothetical protein
MGLPLVPWTLAEAIGKAAAKKLALVPDEIKKEKKKAKRKGLDAAAAVAAVHNQAVKLPLPTAKECVAMHRAAARFAAASIARFPAS